MKKLVFVLIILIVASALYSEQLSNMSFDITAFKRGGNPKTIINVTTGVSDSFSYSFEDGLSGLNQSNVYDVTAIAARSTDKKSVADAIIIEYMTNRKDSVTITLEFTPFKRYSYNGDIPTLDNQSQWLDADYYSPNPDSGSNDFIGSAEDCLYDGEYYDYYSKLTTASVQYEDSDLINFTVSKNGSNTTITLTNKIIAKNGGQNSDILTNNHNSVLPGIGTKMLVSKRVFSLKNINFAQVVAEKDYISTVTITIGAN